MFAAYRTLAIRPAVQLLTSIGAIMRMQLSWVLLGLLVIGWSSTAQSQLRGAGAPGRSVHGEFQLGLTTPFLNYLSLTIEPDGGGEESDVGPLRWGFAEQPIVLEAGYGVSDNVVLGGVLVLGGRSTLTDPESSLFAVAIGPKIEYMFSSDRVVPYVGARFAINVESLESAGGVDSSATTFRFAARLGLRGFLADAVSVDSAFTAGPLFGSGSMQTGFGEADVDISGFGVGLEIGMSLWID